MLHGTLGELLRDPEYFRKVRVDDEARTAVWPNGLDPAPELLRGDCESAIPERTYSQTPAVRQVAYPLSATAATPRPRQLFDLGIIQTGLVVLGQ